MAKLSRTVRNPRQAYQAASKSLARRRRGIGWAPTTGMVVGGLALVATLWFLPEVVRYIKAEMM